MSGAPSVRITSRMPVFIHIEKTGGTSIEKALDIIPHNHKTYQQRQQECSAKNAWSFSVVRNPFDLVVSKYHWRKYHTNQIPKRDMSFNEWCILAYGEESSEVIDNPNRFLTQFDWLKNSDEEITLKQILRFEALQKDFDLLCENLGRVPQRLPHEHKTERAKDYRLYYNNETRPIVEQYFKKDLEVWEYSF